MIEREFLPTVPLPHIVFDLWCRTLIFKVYRVTTTSTTTESLPLLNNRDFSADSYDWEEFERRENEKLKEQQESQIHGESFKLN